MEFHCFPPSSLFRAISQKMQRNSLSCFEKNTSSILSVEGWFRLACLVFQPHSFLTSLAANLTAMYLVLHQFCLSLVLKTRCTKETALHSQAGDRPVTLGKGKSRSANKLEHTSLLCPELLLETMMLKSSDVEALVSAVE